MSRATRRISSKEKPSAVSATVATLTSPKSLLTKGPMVPWGREGWASAILLRRFCQIGSISKKRS